MGLDMYLTARRSLADYKFAKDTEQPIAQAIIKAAKLESLAEPDNTVKVEVCAAYWRKANAIHQWFVDNVQDGVDECQESYLSRSQLQELLDTCKKVAADFTKAPDLLPTQSGFFFGSTEYGEWYKTDVKETITKLERILAHDADDLVSFYYQASW